MRALLLTALLAIAVVPSVRAAAAPPSIEEIRIPSGGARLNGLIYLAAGEGPRPVVVFLHGYPGNERNLDLAQEVRRAGFHALYVDYRGSWGTGGTFSFANAQEDVAAVLAWVRAPENAARFRFDASRVAIVGHSFGGWLALLQAERETPNVCIAALAAWNVGVSAKRFADHDAERAEALAYFKATTTAAGGPIHADPADLQRDMVAHAAAWDYLSHAAGSANRALLLGSSTHDSPDEDVAMHRQIASAVRAKGGSNVTVLEYDDDHSFSAHRLELGTALVHWLESECLATQTAR